MLVVLLLIAVNSSRKMPQRMGERAAADAILKSMYSQVSCYVPIFGGINLQGPKAMNQGCREIHPTLQRDEDVRKDAREQLQRRSNGHHENLCMLLCEVGLGEPVCMTQVHTWVAQST